jgi:hypothetical protein
VVFANNPVISCKNSILKLKSAPMKIVFFIWKFVINGSPKPNGTKSKILSREVFMSAEVSVINGTKFILFSAVCPRSISPGEKYFKRSKD